MTAALFWMASLHALAHSDAVNIATALFAVPALADSP